MPIIIKTKGWFVLWILWALMSSFVWSVIPAQERAALIDFYRSTSGDHWSNNSGWKTPPLHTDGFAKPGTEGQWFGVTVTGDHVTKINLQWNLLRGPISNTIENLGQLDTLELAYNQICGSIPAELGNLVHLTRLSLKYNEIFESIPPSLGNLVHLLELDLTHNKLSGSIPSELGNLLHLTRLSLMHNEISYTIPPSLGNLNRLIDLMLGYNEIDGTIPASLGNLYNLEYLSLNDNHLYGFIPAQLGNLTRLKELDLSVNGLEGWIPYQLGYLMQMESLRLSNNSLCGEIPLQFTLYTHIRSFDISNNCLYTTEPGLRDWLNLHDPDWEATQNNCEDRIPCISIISPNGGEMWLTHHSYPITWEIFSTAVGPVKIQFSPDNGASWTTVVASTPNTGTYLWTVPNTISSQCRVKISEVPDGVPVDISENTFTIKAAIPPKERAALIRLYESTHGDNWTYKNGWKTPPLHTDGFALPGTEGNWIGVSVENNYVSKLYLRENNLLGLIPYELENLSQVSSIYLYNNHLTGIIPPGLGNLTRLYWLDLYGNQLTGPIPSSFGNLLNLQCLGLSFNKLCGTIPIQLKNLSHLISLSLNNNQLEGTIPQSLGNLGALKTLSINHNKLSGIIPTSLTQLTRIDYLDIGYNCLQATDPTLRTWLTTHDPDWEAHQDQCTPITIHLNRTHLNFTAIIGGSITWPQQVNISHIGSGSFQWSISSNPYWLSCSPDHGSGDGSFRVSVNPAGMAVGTYSGTISVSAVNAAHSPLYISVTLRVKPLAEDMTPFGEFATPGDNSIVYSSVPVTGWVLDDVGAPRVQIYREEGSELVLVGNAIPVEGARPDVEVAYPDYPLNYRAGWGYMLLTNILPHGDGQYKLHAIATDISGQSTDLGTKTITVDNAHAVKPFGAIDTPLQGGVVAGKQYLNFGWVLTPPPNIIPTDGSTIHLWIDGQDKGNPTYNNYREDIATLFPGYANSNGAIGYTYIDTTTYVNGLHTMQWTATDSAGNTDGIGSRYFTIQNSGSSDPGSMANDSTLISAEELIQLSPSFTPVSLRKGFDRQKDMVEMCPDEKGNTLIFLRELEPVEIYFTPHRTFIISALPVGASFEHGNGVFRWQPGPGFVGPYPFIFIEQENDGTKLRREILITILPRFQNNKIELDKGE